MALINREQALSHPFANGQYDKEHADEHFIMGFEDYKEWLEDLPIVEAIPKDQYEARLKADMVAMLEELLAELKELPKACFYEENEFGDVTGCIDYPAISKNALDLIQQKINELKEQRDETV